VAFRPIRCSAALAVALTGLAAAACASAGPFSYDAGQPLRFVDRGRVNHGYPIAVNDISYTSGKDRINGLLIIPPRRGRLPAVVYLHGTPGDRTTFLLEASWIAAHGAIGLTITAPSSVTPTPRGLKGLAALRWEVQLQARDVTAIRRAVDMLQHRKDVDPSRIGFVGWSGGARTGAILAGVEPRWRAVVLMSGGATPVSAYTSKVPKTLRAAFRKALDSIDPLHYVHEANPAGLFLQDGQQDQVVPRAALLRMVHAAPSGAKVRWYVAGHALNATAFREQIAWLVGRLRIAGPPVKGAQLGP
jgi:dipeptidyl aminopeptidase/acylaminoacyl peptidase